jgi:NitT/TauT family transport system permease protein
MKTYFPSDEALRSRGVFSRWDLIVIPLILASLYLLTIAFRGAVAPFNPSTPDLTVSLDPINLHFCDRLELDCHCASPCTGYIPSTPAAP